MTKYTIIFLFLLNFITGMLLINDGIFHPDSVYLAQAVENTYKTAKLQPTYKGRYGLVIINSILYLPFFLSGQNADFTTRLSSILFHALSIVALFIFIKELFKDYIQAIFGALLLSFTPFYISANTYGKEHGVSIFFLLLSFYLLLKGLNKKSLVLLGLSSFLFAFSITIKESLLLAIPLYLLLYFNPRISTRPLRISFSLDNLKLDLILSVILPFLIVFGLAFFSYLKYEIYRALFIRDNNSTYFLGLFSTALKIACGDLLICISPLLFIFFLLGIARMLYKKYLFYTFFLLLWFMLIFYFGNTNSYVARYLDIVIIPIYIFASFALSSLYSQDKTVALGIIIYFVLSMLIFIYPKVVFRHRYNGQKQFALYVKEKTEKNAMIIAMDDGPFLDYYGDRRFIRHPIENPVKMAEFVKRVSQYLKSSTPVYLIDSAFSYDDDKSFKKGISEKFKITPVGEELTEDWHRADLKFQMYIEKLYKVQLKETLP